MSSNNHRQRRRLAKAGKDTTAGGKGGRFRRVGKTRSDRNEVGQAHRTQKGDWLGAAVCVTVSDSYHNHKKMDGKRLFTSAFGAL